MKNFLKEFKSFIATGNMIELAVAVILGAAVKAVIDAFIANVANPIIGAIFGKPNLDNVLRFTLRDGGTDDPADDSVLAVGAVLTQFISLVLVGLVLFMVIKAYNRLKKSAAEEAPAGPSEIDLLTEIRDALKARG
ncbi:MAG TPA: large conductance mechanosensitive channel protein MscL [Acidimicrobiaceae bacterium]|nr:large conductance mechanosensitive channel protein MscL [Acidimicrobiaceae bacterium]